MVCEQPFWTFRPFAKGLGPAGAVATGFDITRGTAKVWIRFNSLGLARLKASHAASQHMSSYIPYQLYTSLWHPPVGMCPVVKFLIVTAMRISSWSKLLPHGRLPNITRTGHTDSPLRLGVGGLSWNMVFSDVFLDFSLHWYVGLS